MENKNIFIAENAKIIGDVRLNENVSIWFGAVIRADINYIEIGKESNIQDLSILHVTEDLPCIIGERVTVGHQAVVHGAVVEDECLIGMGAVILDGVRIGKKSIIAAGSVVKENTQIPEGVLVAGVPGEIKRELRKEEKIMLAEHALEYVELAKRYLKGEIH